MTAGARSLTDPDSLPTPLRPYARYRPIRWDDDLLYVSGQVAVRDGNFLARGRLGSEVATDVGRDCARLCAENALAAVKAEVGALLDIQAVVKVVVFVSSAPGFTEQHLVADGASDIFVEYLGERGEHSRSAIGVSGLPMDSPVEVEAIVRVGGRSRPSARSETDEATSPTPAR